MIFMKKKLLLTIFSAFLGAASFAQDIEIHYEGVATPSPEATVDGEVGGAFAFKGYYVVNISGAPVDLTWTRKELFAETCLSDQVCTDENCYTPFDDDAIFNSPESATIAVGDSIYFKVGAASDTEDCCAINVYYLKTGLGIVRDSIHIKYRIGETECFLSTEKEMVQEEIAVFPNPASDNVTITVGESVDFVLYNILGDALISEKLTVGQNSINVQDLPNGVYFYAIGREGAIVETKKLIVRH